MRTGRDPRGWGAGGPTDPRLRRLRRGYARRPRAGRAPPTLPRASRYRPGVLAAAPAPQGKRIPNGGESGGAGRRGRSRAAHLGAAVESSLARRPRRSEFVRTRRRAPTARGSRRRARLPGAGRAEGGRSLWGQCRGNGAGMGRGRAPALRGGRLRPRRRRRPREAPPAPPAGVRAREAGPAALEWEGTRERRHRSPESSWSLVAQCSVLVLLPLPAL